MSSLKTHIILNLTALGILSGLLTGCVESFQPELEENDLSELIVVEGLISDVPGSMKVSLSYTAPLYSESLNLTNEYPPVSGAEVQIYDDRGNAFLLTENEPGQYEPVDENAHGIPGYSYFLSVRTPEGKQLESSMVLMEESPEIEEIYFQEESRTIFDQETPYEQNWLNIMVNTMGSGESTSYYKWDFEETWEFEMPEYVQVYHGTGQFSPPPTMETIEIEEEKRHCWVSESSASILTASTYDSPDNEIHDFILKTIGPPDDRLNIKYSILVKQYKINSQLYDFFKNVRESNTESGGIYARTPLQISGNMQSCDGTETVLGYFMASTMTSKRIFISSSEHEVDKGSVYDGCGWTTEIPRYLDVYLYGTSDGGETNIWSTNRYCTDCRVRGTHEMPDFWE